MPEPGLSFGRCSRRSASRGDGTVLQLDRGGGHDGIGLRSGGTAAGFPPPCAPPTTSTSSRRPRTSPAPRARVVVFPFWASILTVACCFALAEVGAVFEQAPLAAVELEDEARDRGVGDVLEAGADPRGFRSLLPHRVDEADQVDADLAVEGGDQVGEFAFAAVGAEVDRPVRAACRAAASRRWPCRGSIWAGRRCRRRRRS